MNKFEYGLLHLYGSRKEPNKAPEMKITYRNSDSDRHVLCLPYLHDVMGFCWRVLKWSYRIFYGLRVSWLEWISDVRSTATWCDNETKDYWELPIKVQLYFIKIFVISSSLRAAPIIVRDSERNRHYHKIHMYELWWDSIINRRR